MLLPGWSHRGGLNGKEDPINWEETSALDRGQRTRGTTSEGGPAHTDDTCFNQDRGLEILGCWTALMWRQEGRSNHHWPLTSNDVSSVVYGYKCWSFCTILHFCLDKDWSIQSKCQQGFPILKVGMRPLFYIYAGAHQEAITSTRGMVYDDINHK